MLGPLSSYLGIVTEYFDISIVVILSPILSAVFLPKTMSPEIAAAAIIAGFALSYMTRPIGASIWGHYSDRIGRRNMMILSMGIVAVATAAVATLPSYAEAGYMGYACYMILRGVVGVAYGGDITAGWAFAIEWAPKRWRGLVGGFIIAGAGSGSFLVSSVSGIFLAHWGNAAMMAYAWRYVFLSALIPFVAVLITRVAITESPLFQSIKLAGKVEKSPLKTLASKGTRRRFLQSTMVALGIGISQTPVSAYFATMLTNAPSVLTVGQELTAYQLFAIGVIVGMLLGGGISQFIGRRRLLLIVLSLSAVLVVPLLFGMVNFATVSNLTVVYSLGFVLGALLCLSWGALPAYINERFGTGHRASGVGLSYAIGSSLISGLVLLSVPAIHSLFIPIESKSFWFTVGLISIIGCIIAIAAVYKGPETAQLDLEKIENPQASTAN
ncbi:MAG TPA: MFS transporter [Candidatus Bathyarchaeia archaeon]|nr:MFS transporter [Candidatus Bathyarchaeia archaeon]